LKIRAGGRVADDRKATAGRATTEHAIDDEELKGPEERRGAGGGPVERCGSPTRSAKTVTFSDHVDDTSCLSTDRSLESPVHGLDKTEASTDGKAFAAATLPRSRVTGHVDTDRCVDINKRWRKVFLKNVLKRYENLSPRVSDSSSVYSLSRPTYM